jgi:serine/threonine protein kinase
MDRFSDPLPDGTTLLQGQYTIKRFLNDGGFGITYLARDSLDRPMVIKECFPRAICRRSGLDVGARAISHREEFRSIVKAFEEEARNLSKFEHPNIVKVHQVFRENQTAYMAMDYIEGRELITAIEQKKLSPDLIISIAKKLLGALGEIHQNGMLHRDISPDNILLGPGNNPVLIDFGAAKQEASQHGPKMTSIRVTKEGYSPQEFYVSGAQQFPSSDLYAFAATLYHAISGTPPPESQARLLALAQEKRDPYQPLNARFAAYPPGLLKAIDKAMNVSPKDRLSLAGDWQKLIDKKPAITLPPVTKMPKVGTGAMAAMILVFVLGIWYFNPKSKPAINHPASPDTLQNADGRNYLAPVVSQTQNWIVEIPVSFRKTANDRLEVDQAAPWLEPELAGDWAKPGVTLTALNGQTLTDQDSFVAAAMTSQDKPFPEAIRSSITYLAKNQAQQKTGQIQLNAARSFAFSNGMEIRQQFRGSAWQLSVEKPPAGTNADIKAGDILLAERVLGQSVNTLDQLVDVLQKLEARNLPKGVFSVRRGGKIELANMALKEKDP